MIASHGETRTSARGCGAYVNVCLAVAVASQLPSSHPRLMADM